MLSFLGFLCVFLENEFEIIFLELAIFPFGQGNFMSLYFDIVALYDVNCGLVDDITFSGRDELAGNDGFKGLQQSRQGLACFQHGAVMGVDLLDVAVAFDKEQVVDFFDLDAAANEAEDDFFAMPLVDHIHDPVHGLVELFLCKWLGQIVGGPDIEGFDGEFIARRQEDDFCLTFLFSHFTGDIGSQQAGHADIQ